MLRVTALDHVVFNVTDQERSLAWYMNELGLQGVFVEEWRRGEFPFPSVRVSPDTIIDLMQGERTGENVNHVCLVIEPTDMDELAESERFEVRTGPVSRSGARGEGTSIYIHDPDGNVLELKHYG